MAPLNPTPRDQSGQVPNAMDLQLSPHNQAKNRVAQATGTAPPDPAIFTDASPTFPGPATATTAPPLAPTPNEFVETAQAATAAKHANATTAPTRSVPTPRSQDPLVPPPVLTSEQTKIRNSLIRGCSSTDAESVVIDTGQVLKVLDLATCEAAGLFKYTVETVETTTKRRRPNSVIPASEFTKSKGMSEVNRELLLHLLQR